MKLSELRTNSVGTLKGNKFIVICRDPEDRSSGVTTVQFESGMRADYVWDRSNPEVEFLGVGRLEMKIIM